MCERLRTQSDRRARQALRTVAEELGRAVGRMHARGIVHGDLRWGNILVVPEDLVARSSYSWTTNGPGNSGGRRDGRC